MYNIYRRYLNTTHEMFGCPKQQKKVLNNPKTVDLLKTQIPRTTIMCGHLRADKHQNLINLDLGTVPVKKFSQKI